MRFSPMLARLFAGASVALPVILLPQAGIVQVTSAAAMPASCNTTATAVACAHRKRGLNRFDVSLTGPSGTRALFGTCPAPRPQTIDLMPPFTVGSYDNRSQCQIELVDSQGMSHPLQFGMGKLPSGLVAVQVIIDPVGFSG